MLCRLLILPLVLAALVSPAAATLLEVTVTGTISSGNDLDGSVFGLGSNGNPAGLPVTIVFLIDTTKAPADSFPGGSVGNYDSQLYNGGDSSRDFVHATWTVNGISRTSFPPNRDQIDQVLINDSALVGGIDSYSIRDGTYDGTPTTNDRYFYVTLSAILAPDLTTGDVLEQPFTSLNASANAQSCGQCAGFWEDHTNGRNENASWGMANTGITISYRLAPVPEPSLAGLLSAGALAFALRRRLARR